MNTREKDLPQREKDLTQREKTVNYSPPKSIRLRHAHCYTDQDAMKRIKSLCVRFPSQDLESFLLRAMRLRNCLRDRVCFTPTVVYGRLGTAFSLKASDVLRE